MADGDAISIRDSIRAARAELGGDEGGSATPEPVQAEPAPAPTEPTPAAEPAQVAAENADGSQGRDEKGRFAPKAQGEPAPKPQEGAQAAAPAAEPKPETAKPAEPEPQDPEAIRPPPSLSAAVKAQWNDLPPEVRKDFSRLEGTVQSAKAEWERKGQRLNRYDEIIGPNLDRWRVNGLDEFTGVQTLLAAQNILDKDPVGGLVHVARSYGVTAERLVQALGLQPPAQAPGAGGQPAPTGNPDLRAMMAEVVKPLADRLQTLDAGFSGFQRSAQETELARITSEVEAFANDPANVYFHNVEQDMAALITSGRAKSVKDAYEQAIWSSPEIRPLLLKAQAQATQPAVDPKKQVEEAQRRKAAEAARSAGSVTGSPAPGSAPPREAPGSIRDSIRAAKQELGAL